MPGRAKMMPPAASKRGNMEKEAKNKFFMKEERRNDGVSRKSYNRISLLASNLFGRMPFVSADDMLLMVNALKYHTLKLETLLREAKEGAA
jgi:hypothetical protein